MVAAVLCGVFACAAPAAVAQAPAPDAAAPAAPPARGAATLVADPGALRGRVARFTGALPDLAPGAPVQIQRQTPDRGWVAETTTIADAGGAFAASWRPRLLGPVVLRAVAGGDGLHAAAAAPTAAVTVYRPSRATWFGPGLYGRRTACGQVLSRRLLGVAHRTLPCGTPIDIYLGGRAVTVPVVDRGPFANGAHYDLTSAAAEQLGLTATTTVGVFPRRGQTMEAPLAPPPPFAETGGIAPGPAAAPAPAPAP
jgi:rare lipoprotein A